MPWSIADNLTLSNTRYKDAVSYSKEEECLTKYHNRSIGKYLETPVERFMIATPRMHMQPESSRIGLYYKRRQIEHLKELRRRKPFSKSGADTCYETGMNSMELQNETERPFAGKNREPLPKNFSWTEALRSPIFEYFNETKGKPKRSPKEPITKSRRKTSGQSKKKLRPSKPIKANQPESPYYCLSPHAQFKKSKSCSKLVKKRPSDKIYTQASIES